MVERIYCEYCNTPVGSSSKFCPNCGSIISTSVGKNSGLNSTNWAYLGTVLGLIFTLYIFSIATVYTRSYGQIVILLGTIALFTCLLIILGLKKSEKKKAAIIYLLCAISFSIVGFSLLFVPAIVSRIILLLLIPSPAIILFLASFLAFKEDEEI